MGRPKKVVEQKVAEDVEIVSTTPVGEFRKFKISDLNELRKIESEGKLYAYDAETKEATVRI